MPQGNMSDFERNVLNDIHSLQMEVKSLKRKNEFLVGRCDNLADHLTERSSDLTHLTARYNELVTCVREGIEKLIITTQNTSGELDGGEVNLLKNRVNALEMKNWEEELQNSENVLGREVKNLALDVSGIRDILTAHTKRTDSIEESLKGMDLNVADRINQFHDDVEGFRNYLAEMLVFNEPLILHMLKEQRDDLGHKIERLEQMAHSHADEAQPENDVSYKERLAQSLANGNPDMFDDLENILRIIPEDNLRVLLGYVKDSVDARHSSDRFTV